MAKHYSPVRVLIILAIAIFFSEVLVMLILAILPPYPTYSEALLDSTMLTLFIAPTLYFFVFRPLAQEVSESTRAEEELREHRDRLEHIVEERTTELGQSVEKLEGEITERKQVEEQLRKLSRTVEQSPSTVMITDTDGAIEYVNPKFTDLTGYTPEEVIGKNPRILKSGHTPPEEYERMWKTITSGGEWRGEFLNKKKDGKLFWESASISPLRDAEGAITHFIAVKEDITKQKRAEEALRESEDRFRSLTQSALEAIISVDRTGAIISWNDGAQAVFGYTEEEALGKSLEFLMPERYREAHRSGIERARSGGEPRLAGRTVEMEGLRKDGSEFPLEISLSSWEFGNDTFFGAIIRDMTQRKLTEEALERAHDEIKEAYDTLERTQATAIAAEKLAAIGRLTTGVSHEVLNPLNAIIMGLQNILDDPELEPDLAGDLRDLEEQAQRIAKIAQGLLLYSRQRPPERRQVDLNETITRTLGLLEYELNNQDIAVELELAEDMSAIQADPDQLRQVVLNLLTNARDAMHNGGKLRLRTALAEPVFDGRGPMAELRVEDTGSGIDPDHLDKLFDPFFTTKPEGEGTGLGLAISKGIVDAHEGVIWAENLPKGGSAFVVRLNLEEASWE